MQWSEEAWMRRGAAALCVSVAMLAGCGGGGDGSDPVAGGTPPPTDTSDPPPTTSAAHPQGLYWSWTKERTLLVTADGWPYYADLFKYVFPKFFDNGFAYIGPPVADMQSVQCAEATKDQYGNALCVPYVVEGSTIRIDGGEVQQLSRAGDGWMIGDKEYKPMTPLQPLSLSGSYTSRSCAQATCTHAQFVFTPDGRFSASSSNTYANTIADLFIGFGGAQEATGTYRIEGTAITLTIDGGGSGKLFFFVDGDTFQMADDRYAKD